MTESTDDRVVEILRLLHNDMTTLRHETRDGFNLVELRLSVVEQALASILCLPPTAGKYGCSNSGSNVLGGDWSFRIKEPLQKYHEQVQTREHATKPVGRAVSFNFAEVS